jgi:hypothetical protein
VSVVRKYNIFTFYMFYMLLTVYTIYTMHLPVQAQYSRSCPIFSSFRYNGSLSHLNGLLFRFSSIMSQYTYTQINLLKSGFLQLCNIYLYRSNCQLFFTEPNKEDLSICGKLIVISYHNITFAEVLKAKEDSSPI